MEALIRAPDEGNEYWFEEGCYILELLNDPSDPELSIARARVPEGGRTQAHHLVGTTERYMILEGHGRVFVGETGRGEDVGPGDVVTIPAAVRQSILNRGPGELVFLALCTPRFERANYRSLAE